MNSVRRLWCQTACWCLVGWGSVPGFGAETSPTATPLPSPPPWQGEVNTLRGAQAGLALVPAKSEAEDHARHQRLADSYRRLAVKYPAVSAVQQAVGDGLADLEQPEAGLPYWQRAAALDPKNAEAAHALGSAYLRAGEARAAAAEFQRAVDDQPEVAEYHFALANVQYLFRHQLLAPPALPDDQAVLRAALEHFRRATALAPADLRLAKAYAETFYVFAQPDWAQALTAWQAVLALSGEQRDFANGHLARISLRLGRRDEAEKYLADIHDPAYDGLKKKLREQKDQRP